MPQPVHQRSSVGVGQHVIQCVLPFELCDTVVQGEQMQVMIAQNNVCGFSKLLNKLKNFHICRAAIHQIADEPELVGSPRDLGRVE